MNKAILAMPFACLTLAMPAKAAVMYTVYDAPNMAVVDVSFSLPSFASLIAMTPANVAGVYASTFNTPIIFTYTNFGGSAGQIGPASDYLPDFNALSNNLIQLNGQLTSPGVGTFNNVLLRINGFAVTRTAVPVVSGAPDAAVPEPATWAMMLVGFGGIGYAMRRNRKVAVSFS